VISDPSVRFVVSHLGWVDHGAVWQLDSVTNSVRVIDLSDAHHLVVTGGTGESFTALHDFDGKRLVITAQSYADPGRQLASVDIHDWAPVMSGDPHAWDGLCRTHVGYLDHQATGAAGYFLVSIGATTATLTRLDWFGDGYDHMYQSVTAAVQVPETGDLLFGVQRSSDLVLCDLEQLNVKREIRLTGHLGNPVPFMRRSAPEVWAVDYDTVVRVDRRTWQVTGDHVGQQPIDGSRKFLGDMWFPADERTAVVARPFLGDVVTLDTSTMTVMARTETSGQPLQAVVLPSGRVVARDWKTGASLFGG
jgi:hypothetical protein